MVRTVGIFQFADARWKLVRGSKRPVLCAHYQCSCKLPRMTYPSADSLPMQAYVQLANGAYSLSQSMAGNAVLGGAPAETGNNALCVAPALQTNASMDSYSIRYSPDDGCPGATPAATVQLPANFSAGCDAACSMYPIALATYYYPPDGSSVTTIYNVVDRLPQSFGASPGHPEYPKNVTSVLSGGWCVVVTCVLLQSLVRDGASCV